MIIHSVTLLYFILFNGELSSYNFLSLIDFSIVKNELPANKNFIVNSGYYTENISAFLEFHLKSLAQKVKSYIKDTTFLRKVASLSPLPDDIILCTIDAVGFYPNIPHD